MGKHKGSPSWSWRQPAAGTDQGKPFDQMSGEEKGKEFDQSDANPVGYAERNFGSAHETEQTRKSRLG